MKKIVLVVVLHLMFSTVVFAESGSLYQHSLFTALADGLYDGTATLAELKTKGDFGIGTLDRLNGELLIVDGNAYQVTADGVVRRLSDETTTPFASVVTFQPEKEITLKEGSTYAQCQSQIDATFPEMNYPCAFRVTGKFSYMKTRSVPMQNKPYPRLVEVTKNQPVFEAGNVEGTIVGFRLPASMAGINVPGYHFHFVSGDKKMGGHVMDFTLSKGAVAGQKCSVIHIVLPENDAFKTTAVSGANAAETHAIEGNGGVSR